MRLVVGAVTILLLTVVNSGTQVSGIQLSENFQHAFYGLKSHLHALDGLKDKVAHLPVKEMTGGEANRRQEGQQRGGRGSLFGSLPNGGDLTGIIRQRLEDLEKNNYQGKRGHRVNPMFVEMGKKLWDRVGSGMNPLLGKMKMGNQRAKDSRNQRPIKFQDKNPRAPDVNKVEVKVEN